MFADFRFVQLATRTIKWKLIYGGRILKFYTEALSQSQGSFLIIPATSTIEYQKKKTTSFPGVINHRQLPFLLIIFGLRTIVRTPSQIWQKDERLNSPKLGVHKALRTKKKKEKKFPFHLRLNLHLKNKKKRKNGDLMYKILKIKFYLTFTLFNLFE